MCVLHSTKLVFIFIQILEIYDIMKEKEGVIIVSSKYEEIIEKNYITINNETNIIDKYNETNYNHKIYNYDRIKPKNVDFKSVINFKDLFNRDVQIISVAELASLLQKRKIVSLADFNYTLGNRKVQIANDVEASAIIDFIKKIGFPQDGINNFAVQALLKKFLLPNNITLYDEVEKLNDIKKSAGQENNKQVTSNSQTSTPVNQQPISTSQNNVDSTQSVPASQANNSSNTQLSGKQVDASKMWSPQSFAGVVYEFNRGVYGISADKFYRKNLDQTYLHHADQTNSIVLEDTGIDNKFGNPFEAAVSAVSYGIVIVQLEGSECFIYLPSTINEYQQKELENILKPRDGFHFMVYKGNLTYDDKDNGEDLNLNDVFAIVSTALNNSNELNSKLA